MGEFLSMHSHAPPTSPYNHGLRLHFCPRSAPERCIGASGLHPAVMRSRCGKMEKNALALIIAVSDAVSVPGYRSCGYREKNINEMRSPTAFLSPVTNLASEALFLSNYEGIAVSAAEGRQARQGERVGSLTRPTLSSAKPASKDQIDNKSDCRARAQTSRHLAKPKEITRMHRAPCTGRVLDARRSPCAAPTSRRLSGRGVTAASSRARTGGLVINGNRHRDTRAGERAHAGKSFRAADAETSSAATRARCRGSSVHEIARDRSRGRSHARRSRAAFPYIPSLKFFSFIPGV